MQNKNTASLLIVDDNEKNLYATTRVLSQLNLNIDVATSGNEALKAVVNKDYFLILMDVQMPDMDGFETVSLLRGNKQYNHIPVIFLTANMKQQSDLINGYSEGAIDYLFKPIEPIILLNKVKIFLDLKIAQLELERLASSDALTGLANRNMFYSFEERTLKLAKRNQSQFAILSLDLDHFKTINDTFGHDVGDDVLRQTAKKIRLNLRYSDIVSRMGGDEFAILLTDISQPQDAAVVADQVLRALNVPMQINDQTVFCGASIGIACYPSSGYNCEALNKAADLALYKAKEQRHSFQFFSAQMQQQMLARLTLKQRLQCAIDNQELEVYYQVKVETKSQQVIGIEALLRWHAAGIGDICPTEFIPMAEETGQIVTLGSWVLQTVSAHMIQWHSDGSLSNSISDGISDGISVAINVSLKQFEQAAFAQEIANLLQQTGLPPQLLELELTESALMADPAKAINSLKTVHASGVKFIIDDFGRGYCSLSYLQQLPIDTIKIDVPLIQAIGNNRQSNAIVTAMIDLAHTLDMKVVAEGVETESQNAFLTAHGCDYLQGCYYSKPLPANELALFLQAKLSPAKG